MTNLYFTICAFFVTLLLTILFFAKKKIQNNETKIFGNMIIYSLIDCICMIIVIGTAYIAPEHIKIMDFFNRIDFIQYILWMSSLFKYIYFIPFDALKKADYCQEISNSINVINIIAAIVVFMMPMNIVVAGEEMYATGPCVYFTYIAVAIYLVMLLVTTIKNIKKITRKKLFPIFSFLVMGIIMMVTYRYTPTLLIIPAVISYINLVMYHTIENPDVKMLSEINIAKDKAEKANAAKTDFLSNMSHEIRTPLNAIVGFSNAIQEEDNLEDAKEDAKDIVLAAQNLLEIVNGILDISKIEANKMEIVNTDYDIKHECESLVKLIKPRLGTKPVEVVFTSAPDLPKYLYGDKAKIKEVITNLLTNAAKYTEQGKISLNIDCVNKNNESSLVISVEDTGRGIKPEQINKLFNKFERLEEDKNTTIEGAGLGLAITKSLVEMMGGKIIVQSVYGNGTKFTIYLKQKISEKTLEDTAAIPLEELMLINKKILIVDDNMLNIKVAERVLKNYGIITESVTSGFECIDKIKAGEEYDLILMDDMMPKMTGTETLHILQELPEFKNKVVVLTANAIEGMREKYIESGFNDYLAKPLDKQELERVLKKFLNKQFERTKFEPLPDDIFEISDSVVEKINSEEIENDKK